MTTKAELNPVILAHLIEQRAIDKPDQEILIFEKGEMGEDILTYGDIHRASNKMARFFLDTGIEKGDRFALFMRNHPEFIYAMTAATTIGAVVVPIDPRSRGERLKYLLENSDSKAVIVSGECLGQLEEVIDGLPELKFISVVWKKEQGIDPADKYHALNEVLEADTWKTVDQMIFDVRHPMEVIYTSGTTGDPKGVILRNNRTGAVNLLNLLAWKYKPNDILYSGLSLTHGNAQAVTLLPALSNGYKTVLSSRFTKSRIWDICRKYGCTSFSLLGGMMAGIFNEPERPDDADNPVKIVISAGTPRAIWEAFEKRFDVKILEWYGAVEGGFSFKPPGVGPIGSFGKTLPGVMELKVVDEKDVEVEPGATGELIVRMLKGETKVDYLKKPEESEEKTRGGWLRTGDMVHRDEKGWFFFDYRQGTELRRAGDFIQPDYVEKVIGEHPDVSDACVYGIPAKSGAPGESDLVVALEPFEGKTIDPESIFAVCKKDLETNFIPSYLQVVDEIPKSISEKALDRVLKEQFSPDADNVYKFDDYR